MRRDQGGGVGLKGRYGMAGEVGEEECVCWRSGLGGSSEEGSYGMVCGGGRGWLESKGTVAEAGDRASGRASEKAGVGWEAVKAENVDARDSWGCRRGEAGGGRMVLGSVAACWRLGRGTRGRLLSAQTHGQHVVLREMLTDWMVRWRTLGEVWQRDRGRQAHVAVGVAGRVWRGGTTTKP